MSVKISFPYTHEYLRTCMERSVQRLYVNDGPELKYSFPERHHKIRSFIFDLDHTLIEADIVADDRIVLAVRPYMVRLVKMLARDPCNEVILWTNGKTEYGVQAACTLEESYGFKFDYIITKGCMFSWDLHKNTERISREDGVLIDDILHASKIQIQVPPYHAAHENVEAEMKVLEFVVERILDIFR